jgi:arsenate reductase-like glutaredoxin family protein
MSAITQIVSETPQDELIAVYQNWMKRFREIIKNRGQYYRNWHNTNPDLPNSHKVD